MFVAALGLALAGCTGSPAHAPATATERPGDAPGNDKPTWSEQLGVALDASNSEVSAEARAILATTLTTGEVTRLQVTEAAELSRACVEDAGMSLTLVAPTEDFAGYEAEVRISTGGKNDDAEAERLGLIARECLQSNLYAVEALYLLQPTAMERNDAVATKRFEEYRVSLVECLASKGVTTDGETTMSEIRELLAEEATTNGSKACMFSTGYAG